MEIIFLTEGGKENGLGHIMRCQALAEEFIKCGHKILFYINGDVDFGCIGEQLAVPTTSLGCHSFEYIRCNWLNELPNIDDSICVIDSYKMSDTHINQIGKRAKKCLWFDDLSNRSYKVGFVLNPSIYAGEIKYQEPNVKFLGGKDFIVLRSGIRIKTAIPPKETLETVCIIMGGTDIKNLAPQFAASLCDYKLNIITSSISNSSEQLKKLSSDKINVFENLSAEQIAQVYVESDLVITAGGQTVNELLHLRKPFIMVKVAENQEGNIAFAVSNGLALLYDQEMKTLVGSCDYALRKKLYDNMGKYDFSRGVEHIVSTFLEE